MSEKHYADFLFAKNGFMTGVASIFDFGSTLIEYNYFQTPEKADFIALKSDWQAVGDSIRYAMRKMDEDYC